MTLPPPTWAPRFSTHLRPTQLSPTSTSLPPRGSATGASSGLRPSEVTLPRQYSTLAKYLLWGLGGRSPDSCQGCWLCPGCWTPFREGWRTQFLDSVLPKGIAIFQQTKQGVKKNNHFPQASLEKLPDSPRSSINKPQILLVLPQQGRPNKIIFLSPLQSQLPQPATRHSSPLCFRFALKVKGKVLPLLVFSDPKRQSFPKRSRCPDAG